MLGGSITLLFSIQMFIVIQGDASGCQIDEGELVMVNFICQLGQGHDAQLFGQRCLDVVKAFSDEIHI